MEYKSSSENLKDESPSQEDIAYSHPTKFDLEPVDDFEHITKEVSPSKEATAQFLQHETSYASNQNRDKGQFDAGEISNSSDVNDEDESQGSQATESNNLAADSSLIIDNSYSSEAIGPDASGIIDPGFGDDDDDDDDDDDNIKSSKNFMLYEKMLNDQGNVAEPLPKEMISDDDKLIDFGPPSKFDETPAKPADFVSTNNSEILMPDPLSDTKNASPTATSQSLPGIINTENETGAHSEKIPPGDGLHLKNTGGLDVSDTEDNVPEPLPKDYPEIGVIEPRAFLSAIGIDNWFRPERLNPRVESLIYWRDVKRSAIAFGSGLAVLLSLCYYSLISVVAYTSLTILATSVSLKVYQNVLQAVQKSTDSNPLKTNLLKILNHRIVTEVFETLKEYLEMDLSLNQEKIREFLDSFVKNLNNAIIELRRRFLIEDIIDSVKFGVLLWMMTYIGSWFNGLSLLIMGYVALFTLPKVYENNKTQIDSNLEIVREKINMISERIRAVVPLGKKDEAKSKDD